MKRITLLLILGTSLITKPMYHQVKGASTDVQARKTIKKQVLAFAESYKQLKIKEAEDHLQTLYAHRTKTKEKIITKLPKGSIESFQDEQWLEKLFKSHQFDPSKQSALAWFKQLEMKQKAKVAKKIGIEKEMITLAFNKKYQKKCKQKAKEKTVFDIC